jgi:hypothetical protein
MMRTTADDKRVGKLQPVDLNAEVWTACDPPINLQGALACRCVHLL